jgi:hypothetical protein
MFSKVKLEHLEEDIQFYIKEYKETEEIKKYLPNSHCHLWLDKEDIENITIKEDSVKFEYKEDSETSNNLLKHMSQAELML